MFSEKDLNNVMAILQNNINSFEQQEKELLDETNDTDFENSDFHPDFEIGQSLGFYEGMKYALNMMKSHKK